MKKTAVLILIVILSISSLSAAKEYILFGADGGYNAPVASPELGVYMHYQLGAEINSSFSIGGGTYLSSDFALSNKDGYFNATNVTFGPAFTVSLSNNLTLASVIGVEAVILTPKVDSKTYRDKYGYGLGVSTALNYVPGGERESRVQMGFTIGTSLSLTFYDGEASPSFSGRIYLGFALSQPFFPVVYYPYYPAVIYDRIVDTYYHPYYRY